MQTYVERDCDFEHEGRKFSAGGAVVTADRAVVYLTKVDGRLLVTDWHGRPLTSKVSVLAVRPTRSWQSTSRIWARFELWGRTYSGSGFGEGMVFHAKAVKP